VLHVVTKCYIVLPAAHTFNAQPKSTVAAPLTGTHPILLRVGGWVGLGGWLHIKKVNLVISTSGVF